jgi:hypothetical protein
MQMKKILKRAAAAALIVGLVASGSIVRADDDAARDESPRRQRIRIADRVAAKHWLGVHAIPIDDTLKSQLNLEDRLIVRSVMPDSPAAKGGLKQHDILLKFGDHDLKNLEGLFKAVAANGEKVAKVVVLRGGKEVTLEIQPTERPGGVEDALIEFDSVWKPLEAWLGGPAGGRLRIVGPGVVEDLPALPGNLSITVTKHNDDPAKITVKRDNDTWEITENDIDTLPEELREHVRRHVNGHHAAAPGSRQFKFYGLDDGEIRITPHALLPEGTEDVLRDQLERAIKQLEQLQQRWNESEPLKALQEEMKSLRQEVERLRDRDKPADPAPTDSRDT